MEEQGLNLSLWGCIRGLTCLSLVERGGGSLLMAGVAVHSVDSLMTCGAGLRELDGRLAL